MKATFSSVLRAGNRAARMRSLTAVVLARSYFTFEARGEELFVGPAVAAGSFGEPFDPACQRGCLQALDADTRCGARLRRRGHHAIPTARSWWPRSRSWTMSTSSDAICCSAGIGVAPP
jgi:hypothetical protein